MQHSEVIGRTRRGGADSWWSRLPALFQPASSGPVRYWQDRGRVAAKCALAAMAAWALARYAAGQPDPYFAPLAALLGVSPTVARSMREGLQYVAGFAPVPGWPFRWPWCWVHRSRASQWSSWRGW